MVIGALGVIKKRMRLTVEKIPGTINIEQLQKIALMGLPTSSGKSRQLTYETLFILRPMD